MVLAEFLVGFSVALLSGLGIGGGGLLVIYLVLFCGTPQIEAQGINLVWFIFSSAASMVVHLIKRKLNFKLVSFLVVFGSVGAVIGSLMAKSIDPEALRKCFGVLLTASGLMTLFKRG